MNNVQSSLTVLVVGAVITAPLVVPGAIAYGALALPILSIKALWHKALMDHHKNKSGFQFDEQSFEKNINQILSLKNLKQLKHADKQIDQKVNLNRSLGKMKSAAICMIPFGVFSVIIKSMSKKKSYEMPAIKKVINDEINNHRVVVS